jgi:signal transduction histidine kinase
MKRSSLEYIIPAILALAITILLVFTIPVFESQYALNLEETRIEEPHKYRYYADLDQDGESEIITLRYNTSENLAVNIATLANATLNQFNLPGDLPMIGATLDLDDISGDGRDDILVCSQRNDSMYLNVIDDPFGRPTRVRSFFLDPLNTFNDYNDYLFVAGGTSDLNGDGYPEYILGINGGHALQPRRIYAIDYRNNRIIRSPLSGTTVNGFTLFDLDKDGRDEILLNTIAPENFKEHIPFRDSVVWFMVLDDNLGFYRPPVPREHQPAWIQNLPFTHEGRNYILSVHRYRKGELYYLEVSVYDKNLELVKRRTFPPGVRFDPWRFGEGLDLKTLRLVNPHRIYTIGFDLEFLDSLVLGAPFNHNIAHPVDVDGDGEREYVFAGNYNITVYRSDLSSPVVHEYIWQERDPRILISAINRAGDPPRLVVQVERTKMFFRYTENSLYRLRFILYVISFLLWFGLFFLLGYLQNRLVERRYQKNRLINQLQIQTIRNQLDPHFIYNALNAMGSLIYKGEKEKAYLYLKGLSDLLRMVSTESDHTAWTLDNELDFVHKYLGIEKLRFREKFNFRVDVEEGLGNQIIPKLCILTFAENAIKHGLRHKPDDRLLKVSAVTEGPGILITVRDNGIGREAAKLKSEEGTGRGIEMMKEYLALFSEATGRKARFRITDLFKPVPGVAGKSAPAGTEVTINIV